MFSMNRWVVLAVLLLVGYAVLMTALNSCHTQQLRQHQGIEKVVTAAMVVSTDKAGTNYTKPSFTSLPNTEESKLLTPAQYELIAVVEKTKRPVAVLVSHQAGSYHTARVVPLVTLDSTSWKYVNHDDTLSYRMQVNRVTGALRVDSIAFRNTSTVVFHDTKDGTVATVTNSNPLLKTNTVESYAVPTKPQHTVKKVLIGIGIGIVTGLYLSHR